MPPLVPNSIPACRAKGWHGNVGVCLKVALLLLAGWFVYSPAMHGSWLWDDQAEISQNPEILDPAGYWKIWVQSANTDFFPLKSTVIWLQWRLWQDHTLGYHLTTVGLHLLSAFLLWRLFRKLGLRLAWFGALLFVVHPIMVGSVAWIAELKNTLSLPPLLLAASAYVDFDERRQWRYLALSACLFLAAMLCKTSVVMFPVVLLLYGWWKRGRISWGDWKASGVFFAISLGLGLVTIWFQHERAIAGTVIASGGFFSRLACAGLAIAFYFGKGIFPVGLLPLYPRWTVDPPSLLQFLPWLGLGLVLYWFWTRRAAWGRHALFGLGFFLVNLAPVLGFIPMSYLRYTWVADHFVYLPLIGLIGLATAGAGRLAASLTGSTRLYAMAGGIVLLGLLAGESRRYAANFQSEETLWSYTLKRNPTAWLAHNNLGSALLNQGQLPEAIAHFDAAVQLKPDYAPAYNNLGIAYYRLGRPAESMEYFRRALGFQSNFAEAHLNLGNTLVQAGRLPEAMEQYRQAIRLTPILAEAHNNLGNALYMADQPTEAIAEFQQAIRIKPDYAEAHENLGSIYARGGSFSEAIAHYQEALQLNPGKAATHNNLGFALVQAGRLQPAIEQFEQAIRLKPDFADAHMNLGGALFQAGRVEDAIRHYETALRLNPDLAEARRNLELIRNQTADRPPARGKD
jgi:tetratricopeptide (TPR) repeat protein